MHRSAEEIRGSGEIAHEIQRGAAVSNSSRWRVAIAGSIVMLVIGPIYSWSIFTQPLLVALNWHLTTITWAYALANFSLAAVGAVLGGFWQDRAGPRKVAMTGVALWGTGHLLTGLGTQAFGAPWLYLNYGVISGIGAGMAYVTPLAAVSKWFPDKRGLAGGLVVAGFGLGAFLYNQWIPRLPDFHAAAVHAGKLIVAQAAASSSGMAWDPATLAGAPSDLGAVMRVFVLSGLTFLVVGLPAAALLRDPPATNPAAQREARGGKRVADGYPPSKILAMPQFYLLWLQLFANAIAGVTTISNAVFILTDLTRAPAETLGPLFGIASIFNAVGRFFWGGVADRIGCERTFAIMFATQAAMLFALSQVHDLTAALAGISIILLCCGGGFGTMPAYCAEYFGTRYMGRNYGLLLSAWGFAGLIGPIFVARLKDVTGSFTGMMPLIAITLCASVILPCMTRKPPPLVAPAS
jgi:OFA family oxalate/formate antiporter-like MFS transporter